MSAPEQITQVSVVAIIGSQFQYRRQMSEEEMAGLVASIREHGIIQPVLLRPVTGKHYKGVTHCHFSPETSPHVFTQGSPPVFGHGSPPAP